MRTLEKQWCNSLKYNPRLEKYNPNLLIRTLTFGYNLTYNTDNYRVNCLQANITKKIIPVILPFIVHV